MVHCRIDTNPLAKNFVEPRHGEESLTKAYKVETPRYSSEIGVALDSTQNLARCALGVEDGEES